MSSELMARHFAGMTGMAMRSGFTSHVGQTGRWASRYLTARWPVLKARSCQYKPAGTHLVYLVAIKILSLADGHGLIYFKRRFHPVRLEMQFFC